MRRRSLRKSRRKGGREGTGERVRMERLLEGEFTFPPVFLFLPVVVVMKRRELTVR